MNRYTYSATSAMVNTMAKISCMVVSVYGFYICHPLPSDRTSANLEEGNSPDASGEFGCSSWRYSCKDNTRKCYILSLPQKKCTISLFFCLAGISAWHFWYGDAGLERKLASNEAKNCTKFTQKLQSPINRAIGHDMGKTGHRKCPVTVWLTQGCIYANFLAKKWKIFSIAQILPFETS